VLPALCCWIAFGAVSLGQSPGQEVPRPSTLQAVTWAFDLETTGQDISWMSPTSVDPAASVYWTSYVITLVEVDVCWIGIPFNGIDVTDQLPPDLAASSLEIPGPAPITILNQPVLFPDPPAAPAVSADLSMGLDASGCGFADASNIILGTLDVDLGIFGVQTVTITRLRIVGDLTVHPAWYDLGNALAGTNGLPSLAGSGSLLAGDAVALALTNARASSPTLLIVGLSRLDAPFAGGTLVPALNFIISGLPTNALGDLTLASTWPTGIGSGVSVYFQFWILDPLGPAGFAASNAVEGVTQ
jgi:hypothetical protein